MCPLLSQYIFNFKIIQCYFFFKSVIIFKSLEETSFTLNTNTKLRLFSALPSSYKSYSSTPNNFAYFGINSIGTF